MPTARQTAATKRAAATIAAQISADDTDDQLIEFAGEETDETPEPGLERVERHTTERTSFVRPLPTPAAAGPAPAPDPADEVIEPGDLMFQDIGPTSGVFVFIYREPDPPNATYRKPYYGTKAEFVTRIAVDERHNTRESLYETLQRMHGGGEYLFVGRWPNGQVRGRWQAAIGDLTETRYEYTPAPPVPLPQPVMVHQPAEPADPFAAMGSALDLLGKMKKVMGGEAQPAPVAAAPPVDPMTAVVSQVSAFSGLVEVVQKLSPQHPRPESKSWVGDLISLGDSEVVVEVGKKIVDVAPMLLQMWLTRGSAAGPANTGSGQGSPTAAAPGANLSAPAQINGAAADTFQCDRLILPRAQNVGMALANFAQVLADGAPDYRQPGLAVQLAEDYAVEFPDFKGFVLEKFAAQPGDTAEEDAAVRLLQSFGANLGRDLLTSEKSVPYMMSVIEGLAEAWELGAAEEEGEGVNAPGVGPEVEAVGNLDDTYSGHAPA